jgi:Ras-related C3 botulinum toxin substrate 1
MPEVRHFCEKTPVILIGTKLDLKSHRKLNSKVCSKKETGNITVLYEEAISMKNKIKAAEYIECSSQTSEGLLKVFDVAIRVALDGIAKKDERKVRWCKLF